MEDTKLGHGVFTYSLLQGLNGEAKDAKGLVTVRGLLKYVEDKVADLTEQLFKRRQFPVGNSTGQDFPLAIVQ